MLCSVAVWLAVLDWLCYRLAKARLSDRLSAVYYQDLVVSCVHRVCVHVVIQFLNFPPSNRDCCQNIYLVPSTATLQQPSLPLTRVYSLKRRLYLVLHTYFMVEFVLSLSSEKRTKHIDTYNIAVASLPEIAGASSPAAYGAGRMITLNPGCLAIIGWGCRSIIAYDRCSTTTWGGSTTTLCFGRPHTCITSNRL